MVWHLPYSFKHRYQFGASVLNVLNYVYLLTDDMRRSRRGQTTELAVVPVVGEQGYLEEKVKEIRRDAA